MPNIVMKEGERSLMGGFGRMNHFLGNKMYRTYWIRFQAQEIALYCIRSVALYEILRFLVRLWMVKGV